MAIADRKIRERKERERLIVEHADDLLRWNGYLGLNLDELAGRIEYSKATIYNHFQSKEDIVLAVATMHLDTRRDLFGRALTFEGKPRERIFVIGEADRILAKLYPHSFQILQLVRTQSIWEKAAEERHAEYHSVGGGCFGAIFEVIRQARAEGDLPGDAPSDQHIVAAMVSMSKGAHLLEDGTHIFPPESGVRPVEILFDNLHIYLDGAGWKPRRSEWDYDASMQRIRDEVFPSELALIESR